MTSKKRVLKLILAIAESAIVGEEQAVPPNMTEGIQALSIHQRVAVMEAHHSFKELRGGWRVWSAIE